MSSKVAVVSLLPLALVLPSVTSAANYNVSTVDRALYFCKASYCDEKQVEDWTCSVCTKDLKEVEDVTTLIVPDTQIKSFIAYDPAIRSVVLTFRGSSNAANWGVNLDTNLVNFPECGSESDCKVHAGFYSAWQKNVAILDGLAGLLEKHATQRVLVTGHSLGGAMATFAALHIAKYQKNPPSIEVYHFGSPRIGNFAFAKHVVNTLPVFFRVTHHRDPFVHVPAMSFGFTHIPHEIYYSKRNGLTYTSCKDQPRDLSSAKPSDFEDPNCSYQWNFQLSWTDDHVYYLDKCTNCDKKPSLDLFGNYCYRLLVDEEGNIDMKNPINLAMLERYNGQDFPAKTMTTQKMQNE